MNPFANMELAWCRIAMLLDINETRLATIAGDLPVPASDLPASCAERIAEDVQLELAQIGIGP